MCMPKKHLSHFLMYHKKAAIFLKQQQDHRNSHVPDNYPVHLIRIYVKHISIFNCFYKKCYHKETSDNKCVT